MRITKWPLLALPLLTACHSAENRDIQRAEDQIRSNMIDPGSAQFSLVRVEKPGLVCGKINGKNHFGGYTGAEPFVARLTKEKVEVTIVSGELPTLMSTAYPAEELGKCFPEMILALKAVLGQDWKPLLK